MVTVFIFVYLGLIDMLVPHSPVLAQGKAGRIYIYPLAQHRILTSHWPFLGEKPPLGIRKKHGINEKKKRNIFFSMRKKKGTDRCTEN